jgi:hypothetical protein
MLNPRRDHRLEESSPGTNNLLQRDFTVYKPHKVLGGYRSSLTLPMLATGCILPFIRSDFSYGRRMVAEQFVAL